MDRVHDAIEWYQKKIGSYDKQLWEQSVERKLQKQPQFILQNAPRRKVRLKTEFIDVDLIRGSTFTKTKPQVPWVYVTKKALARVLFFPFYYSWWIHQTSRWTYAFLLCLYVLQVTSICVYISTDDGFLEDELSFTEVILPLILMFLLCLIHSQTVLAHITHKPPKHNKTISGMTRKPKPKPKKAARKGRNSGGNSTCPEDGGHMEVPVGSEARPDLSSSTVSNSSCGQTVLAAHSDLIRTVVEEEVTVSQDVTPVSHCAHEKSCRSSRPGQGSPSCVYSGGCGRVSLNPFSPQPSSSCHGCCGASASSDSKDRNEKAKTERTGQIRPDKVKMTPVLPEESAVQCVTNGRSSDLLTPSVWAGTELISPPSSSCTLLGNLPSLTSGEDTGSMQQTVCTGGKESSLSTVKSSTLGSYEELRGDSQKDGKFSENGQNLHFKQFAKLPYPAVTARVKSSFLGENRSCGKSRSSLCVGFNTGFSLQVKSELVASDSKVLTCWRCSSAPAATVGGRTSTEDEVQVTSCLTPQDVEHRSSLERDSRMQNKSCDSGHVSASTQSCQSSFESEFFPGVISPPAVNGQACEGRYASPGLYSDGDEDDDGDDGTAQPNSHCYVASGLPMQSPAASLTQTSSRLESSVDSAPHLSNKCSVTKDKPRRNQNGSLVVAASDFRESTAFPTAASINSSSTGSLSGVHGGQSSSSTMNIVTGGHNCNTFLAPTCPSPDSQGIQQFSEDFVHKILNRETFQVKSPLDPAKDNSCPRARLFNGETTSPWHNAHDDDWAGVADAAAAVASRSLHSSQPSASPLSSSHPSFVAAQVVCGSQCLPSSTSPTHSSCANTLEPLEQSQHHSLSRCANTREPCLEPLEQSQHHTHSNCANTREPCLEPLKQFQHQQQQSKATALATSFPCLGTSRLQHVKDMLEESNVSDDDEDEHDAAEEVGEDGDVDDDGEDDGGVLSDFSSHKGSDGEEESVKSVCNTPGRLKQLRFQETRPNAEGTGAEKGGCVEMRGCVDMCGRVETRGCMSTPACFTSAARSNLKAKFPPVSGSQSSPSPCHLVSPAEGNLSMASFREFGGLSRRLAGSSRAPGTSSASDVEEPHATSATLASCSHHQPQAQSQLRRRRRVSGTTGDCAALATAAGPHSCAGSVVHGGETSSTKNILTSLGLRAPHGSSLRDVQQSKHVSSSENEAAGGQTPEGSHKAAVSSEEWEDRIQTDETTSSAYSTSCGDSGAESGEGGARSGRSLDDDMEERTEYTTSTLHVLNLLQPEITSEHTAPPSPQGVSSSNVTQLDRVSCLIWEGNECKKVDLTALDIGWAIIDKVDSLPESSDYFLIGLLFSVLIGLVPLVFRAYVSKEAFPWEEFATVAGLLGKIGEVPSLAGAVYTWRQWILLVNSVLQRFSLSLIFFFLLSVADRTFKQRLLYAKHFSYLTSSRRARKFSMPHFRLSKVRNIKIWLSLRSYLKRRGPQRSVDVIVSACFMCAICTVSLISLQMLKDSENYLDYLCNWELLVWCLGLAIFLMHFMTVGLKINKKYRNLSVLITEQINLYLQMEQKPHKKEELILANNVLRLAEDLLKELESPFKISGFSANPVIYNIMRVVVLSAFSAVLTEVLGFKLKLHKIKLKG